MYQLRQRSESSCARTFMANVQANVYYAAPSRPDAPPTAVKVYRTSILKFRARQDYIVGEHRFAGEYSHSRNSRKMVRVWAEKELRNLKRLQQGGILAPRVIEGTANVLVMDFIGDNEMSVRSRRQELTMSQCGTSTERCCGASRSMARIIHRHAGSHAPHVHYMSIGAC